MSNPTTSPKWHDSALLGFGLIFLSVILWYMKIVPIWAPIIVLAVVLLVKNANVSSAKTKKKTTINNFNKEQFSGFGTSVEEREKNIKKMFANKSGNLSFATWWDFNSSNGQSTVQSSLNFKISRNIMAMEPKEREFLKTALLLYNSQKINDQNYNYYLLAFLYGNGKCTIDDWSYSSSHENYKDGPGVVKFYVDKSDASVDSAINALLRVSEKISPDGNGGLFADNAWLSRDDINNSIFNGAGEYRLQLGLLDGYNLSYGGEGSLITIAPPSSGKTQCFVLPNMLSWPGAAVVLDVTGQIYQKTHKWRSQNVGPVYKFSPIDPNSSHSYNPLTFIRRDPDFIWADSKLLADMMIVPSGGGDSKFWEDSARDLLTAAIAYVSFNNNPGDRTMRKVMNILSGKDLQEMIISLKSNALVAPMEDMGYALSNMEKKTMESVLQTARASMSAWQEPLITRITQKSDWHPLELRQNKPTIYICIDPAQIDAYLSILRVFIAQHVQILFNNKPPDGRRDAIVPVLFMLDEFPKLKNMPPIDMALNVGAGYGIRLWMFAQSYGQLKESYQNAEGMLGSCAVRTFMNVPLQDELATKLSDQLGDAGFNLDGTPKKLVEPRELSGPDYRDIALVISTGTKPARVQKAFAWQSEELNSRMLQT